VLLRARACDPARRSVTSPIARAHWADDRAADLRRPRRRLAGAAAAFTLVLVVVLVLEVVVPGYDVSPGTLLPLLGAILALLGLEASALWRGVR
jgi:hypothetical protein